MSEHERWVDAAGAYVLEAMPEDEREAFERHLDDCAACREEVAELLPAAHALPMASPQMTPPPELKARIMAEVEREAALLAQAGESADRPAAAPPPRGRGRERGGWLSGWRLAPVAAALLIAGVLAGTALDREPAAPGQPQVRTVAVTVDPKRAPDGTAELRVTDGEAMLVGRGMPAPPEGRVYQVWVMPKGSNTPKPTNALFYPRADGSVATTIPDVSDAKMVLVTDEPLGGSDEPSRTPVMTAAPS